VSQPLLWHGGVGGLWRGQVLEPGHAAKRYVEGCACCEAQEAGHSHFGIDPATPEGWVYATNDREYARWYASRAVKGWLYRVELLGDVEPSTEDPFPTWRARSARIHAVPERNIVLSMAERRRIFLRWGGTEEEFEAMVASVFGRGALIRRVAR
jgi:hypothetical protein